MKPMKGVSLVFEQVLLFMIGVMIFSACFVTFSLYQQQFTGEISQDQLNEIRDSVSSAIIDLSSRETDVNTTMRRDLLPKIGDAGYVIEINSSGLFVYTLGPYRTESFSPLYGINHSMSLSGRFSSIHGRELMIYKNGNEIIIA
jgi:hypothetical protein